MVKKPCRARKLHICDFWVAEVFSEWEEQREHPHDMLVHLGDCYTVYYNILYAI